MRRRQAIRSAGALAGGVFLVPQFLTGCKKEPYKYELFQWGDTELFNEVAEFILPATTDSPGARAADVGDFIQLMVTDCYSPANQEAFLNGFRQFKLNLEKTYGHHFIDLEAAQKAEILEGLKSEANAYYTNQKPGEPEHFYAMLITMVMVGYFTSETGATQALRYVPVPGEQKGIVPYNGEKAWAL